MSSDNRIKLFVVDDSAIVRNAFTTIVEKESNIELVGVASNPIFAKAKIDKLGYLPDVMILDLEMPQMDGLTYLKLIMRDNPFPVIICSGIADKGSSKAIEALTSGALEIIEKPSLGVNKFFEESKRNIISSIFSASKVRSKKSHDNNLKDKSKNFKESLNPDDFLPILNINKEHKQTDRVVAIGSSTGGVQILEQIISKLKENSPPILIVQHMPKGFTKSLADRLNRNSKLNIVEAQNGDVLERDKILIAPGGDKHMLLKRTSKNYIVEIKNGPKINHHRPSVDVLFRSFVNEAGKNGVGFILTGMGNDGAYGLKEMRDKGALTVSQDEDSCTVYGMPKEAVLLGAVSEVMTPSEISKLINKL